MPNPLLLMNEMGIKIKVNICEHLVYQYFLWMLVMIQSQIQYTVNAGPNEVCSSKSIPKYEFAF